MMALIRRLGSTEQIRVAAPRGTLYVAMMLSTPPQLCVDLCLSQKCERRSYLMSELDSDWDGRERG